MNMQKLTLLWSCIFIVVFTSKHSQSAEFTTRDLNDQSILALSWMQTAAEYKALAHQAFNIAKLRWNMDKMGGKRAVVVDLDETVIDNSPFNAGLIGKDFGYSNSTWKEWCEDVSATALPGAVDFLKHVDKTGGTIFYITNRKEMPKKNIQLLEVTMRNLQALGFPQVTKEQMFLRSGTSNKQPRRNMIISQGYRIVLLLGDNLNDFSEAFGQQTLQERAEAVELERDKFGDKFIVLPNPIYGAWEAAVYGGGKWYKKSPQERSELRKGTMKRFSFSQ